MTSDSRRRKRSGISRKREGWLQEEAFRQRRTSLTVFRGRKKNGKLDRRSRSGSFSIERMTAESNLFVQYFEEQENNNNEVTQEYRVSKE